MRKNNGGVYDRIQESKKGRDKGKSQGRYDVGGQERGRRMGKSMEQGREKRSYGEGQLR